MKLQTHEQRVVVEKYELDLKINSLKDFISDDDGRFETLTDMQKILLRDQLTAMKAYSRILGERIDIF